MTEVAAKLAHAIANANAQHAAQQAETAAVRHASTVHDLFETWESEIAALWREKGLPDFNGPMFSDEVRRIFGSITEPTHQADFIFSILAMLGIAVSGAFSAASGINQQLNERSLNTYADIKPDASTTAALAVRGFITDATMNTWMGDVGTQGAVRQALTDAAWNHNTNDVLLTLVRLGKIPEDRARAIMRYGGMTPEEIEDYLGLIVVPPSADTMVRAAVQGHIDLGTLAKLLAQNGIDPAFTDILFETAGRPPGTEQLIKLLNRDKITEQTLRDAIVESDIKPKYVQAIVDSRYHPPPQRSIVAQLRKGAIDEALARKWLGYVGLLPEAIDAAVKEAQTVTSTAGKHLSMQQHLAAYEAQLETREAATSALVAIGWSATDVELELDVADHRATLARQAKAANLIGTRYVGWKIDRAGASMALDALGLPAAARDEALAAWDIEREERRPKLTLTQLEHVYKAGKVSLDTVEAKLADMGYDQAEADFLLAGYFPPSAQTVKTQRDLTRADQVKRYTQGSITRDQLKAALEDLGYDATEAEQIAVIADGGPPKTGQ